MTVERGSPSQRERLNVVRVDACKPDQGDVDTGGCGSRTLDV